MREIYKGRLDEAVSLINDGYKIDVFINDIDNVDSYIFVGYIYRKNEGEENHNDIEFIDDYNKSIKEKDLLIREKFVKVDFKFDNNLGSLIPIIFISQYKTYNRMIEVNANAFYYYAENIDKFVSKEYKSNDFNTFIYNCTLNNGYVNRIVSNDNNQYNLDVFDFTIYNTMLNVFSLYSRSINFYELNSIVYNRRNIHLYLPICAISNKDDGGSKKIKYSGSDNDKKTLDDNFKYQLNMHSVFFFDNTWGDDYPQYKDCIKIYKGLNWDGTQEPLSNDICKTSFSVHTLDNVNISLIDIVLSIRYIDPKNIIRQLNGIHKNSDIYKEIIKTIDVFNDENRSKMTIKPITDWEYNHYVIVDSYYNTHYENYTESILKNVKEYALDEILYACDEINEVTDALYLTKFIGLNIGRIFDTEFNFSILKYFIINNLSNSLTENLIAIKRDSTNKNDSEKVLLGFDRQYLDYSMLSSRNLYNKHINYETIESYDSKLHTDDINTQYKKNLELYKEIVDFESKKRSNDLANKLNIIQIMSILLTVIGWCLVLAQANMLNKTFSYILLIVLAALSGLLVAIIINKFISK